MKYLIVNADDFGASRGVNRGILEAHRRGILTSTSLLVKGPQSEEAVALGRDAPELSIGLHVNLDEDRGPVAGRLSRLQEELRAQFRRFEELTGRRPTHIDSHHNVHRDPDALPAFLALAARHGLPLREHSPARYFSKFYGQWGGQTHLEQISTESLTRMLETEIEDGITELSCHPGYAEPDYPGSYRVEREAELRTLCDPAIREVLAARSIQLISYHDRDKLEGVWRSV
jgi:chitin disaccharide deacetylase